MKNVFIQKSNKKFNPDVLKKVEFEDKNRTQSVYKKSNQTYNSITNQNPENIKTQKDLELEKDNPLDNIEQIILQKKKEREEQDDKLKPVMTLKTYIIQLKDVKKGEGIGYNWKYIAKKNIKVAVLPLGYADVIPRMSSGKLYVYVNGTKRKILGTISMDQIIIEAKEKDKINDDVILFGNGINCPQTVLKLSKHCDTIPEEILCRIGYRVNRIYVNK